VGWGLATKMTDVGLVLQKQCGGALKKADSGMVEFKRSKLLLLTDPLQSEPFSH
jgi:hypothetical protein